MKAFHFRLDRILRLKEEAEQQRARAMGEAARTEAAMDQMCVDQAEYARTVGDRVSAATAQPTSAGMLRSLHLTAAAAMHQLEDAEKARVEARKAADDERIRLAEAQRERRTLERLKEHQRSAWSRDLALDERKAMDEVAGRIRGTAR